MTTQSFVRVAMFAALIGALGLLPRFDLPLAGGVPITAQSFGVMLAGVILGARLGAAAVLLLVFVVALGAPLLAGGRGGFGVFFGPTVGFLLGWIPAAIVTGIVFRLLSRLPTGIAASLAAFAGGVVVLYACGIVGLALITGMPLTSAALASLVFLPGDVLKAIGTGLIAAAMPSLRQRGAAAEPFGSSGAD